MSEFIDPFRPRNKKWRPKPSAEEVRISVGVFKVSRNTDRPATWDHLKWEVVQPMIDAAEAYAAFLEMHTSEGEQE
jgi:hypothetical protein